MPQAPKRVLCVEDNEDIRFLLTTVLHAAGYDAAAAAGGGEAIELVRGEYFDLFVLDTKLGGESGLDLCRTLREMRPAAPVIFYSGAVYDSDKEEGLRAGACAYVAKPGVEGLIEAVRLVLADSQEEFEPGKAD